MPNEPMSINVSLSFELNFSMQPTSFLDNFERVPLNQFPVSSIARSEENTYVPIALLVKSAEGDLVRDPNVLGLRAVQSSGSGSVSFEFIGLPSSTSTGSGDSLVAVTPTGASAAQFSLVPSEGFGVDVTANGVTFQMMPNFPLVAIRSLGRVNVFDGTDPFSKMQDAGFLTPDTPVSSLPAYIVYQRRIQMIVVTVMSLLLGMLVASFALNIAQKRVHDHTRNTLRAVSGEPRPNSIKVSRSKKA